jgi:uncharacterized membrane protein
MEYVERPSWADFGRAERMAFGAGAALLVSGLAHLVILLISGASWFGPISWRKPATFGLSFGLTLITVTWVSSYLDLPKRSRAVLIAAITLASVWETTLVSLQAWRHVPSHFNLETSFDAVVARALAAGGFVLVLTIVSLTIAAFRRRPRAPESLTLAIRAGFVSLLGAQVVGAIMIAVGMRHVFNGDVQAAYATSSVLKWTHGVLMHGILVSPAVAFYAGSRAPKPSIAEAVSRTVRQSTD